MNDPQELPEEAREMFRRMTLDHIAHLEQYCQAREPGGSLLPSLSPAAMQWIGYIISQWGALEDQLSTQIIWMKQYPNVPEELRVEEPRHEFRYRIRLLRKLIAAALPGQRENALKLYERTLSRITTHKLVRDSLAHGHYALDGNQDFDGVTVIYKGHKIAYPAKRLEQTAIGIGQCSGFFLNFQVWNQAPEQKALLEESLGQDPAGTILVTPPKP